MIISRKPFDIFVTGLGALLMLSCEAFAQPWAMSTTARVWCQSLASSADGKILAAAVTGGDDWLGRAPGWIYVSTNAGMSWTTNGPSSLCIACSADGLTMAAVSAFDIYISRDLGATWTPANAPAFNWTSIASSANGARIVAAAAPLWDQTSRTNISPGAIYRSLDAGATWIETSAPNTNWTCVASSADGTKLVAGSASRFDYQVGAWVGEGGIYRSLDSGATWEKTSAPAVNWSCVAASADGSKLVAAVNRLGIVPAFGGEPPGGMIYTSTNSGVTWTPCHAPATGWDSVACSADGTRLVAASETDYWDGTKLSDRESDIYESIDLGATWKPTGAREGTTAVACSADGYRLLAAGAWREIYTWPYSGPWRRLFNAQPIYELSCSSDATKLAAVGAMGFGLDTQVIFCSRDSGVTWSQTSAPTNYWSCTASSADGTRLVAGAYPGGIYCSSNSGAIWLQTSAPSNNWISVASSADGIKLVALAVTAFDSSGNYWSGDAAIYLSSNAGMTWGRANVPSNHWYAIAASTNCMNLVAAADGTIYRSTDAGISWTMTSAPSNLWISVASSADGGKVVAGPAGGVLYTSSDSGATWQPTSVSTGNWAGVSCSHDGTILFAAQVYPSVEHVISTNSGVSWVSANVPAGAGSSVACSADGSTMLVPCAGGLALLRSPAALPPTPPSPQLVVATSNGNFDLSWLVPSTLFVLEQNSNLLSAGWASAQTPPSLNLTNLHYHLTLPAVPGDAFYRLKKQ